MAAQKSSAADAAHVLSKYETILFDCDGVIWCGKAPIPGVDAAIRTLQRLGKRIFFVSNNSTKDRALYIAKLAGMGIAEVEEDQIFHSGFATAQYLKSHREQGLMGRKVYVLGEEGLQRELRKVADVEIVEDAAESAPYDPDALAAEAIEPVSAVVVGMDFTFTMRKMARAVLYLSQGGEGGTQRPQFILTNPDAVIPINGKAMPEAATIAAAISANVGYPPDVTCGKPHPLLFSIIQSAHPKVCASTTLMVGDRIDTDIQFGVAAGVDTLLVLSGFQKLQDVSSSEVKPTYIFDSVPSLVDLAGVPA